MKFPLPSPRIYTYYYVPGIASLGALHVRGEGNSSADEISIWEKFKKQFSTMPLLNGRFITGIFKISKNGTISNLPVLSYGAMILTVYLFKRQKLHLATNHQPTTLTFPDIPFDVFFASLALQFPWLWRPLIQYPFGRVHHWLVIPSTPLYQFIYFLLDFILCSECRSIF